MNRCVWQVLNRSDLFAPINKGGLGMNGPAFFEDTYRVHKSFNPPRWVDAKHWFRYTLCGWLNKT
ncbi:MAG TPA: hypothetical protein VMP41_10690 [Acidimicrobiales bacterium]|nr:hypothetical protein [Acidimicrobiales bacterium]